MAQTTRSQSQTIQKKRISLEEIAEQTKISPLFLAAIEREEFGKLPGGIFDRSYIRQYASAAGLDENEILQRYHEFQAEKEFRAAEKNGSPSQQRRTSSLRSLMHWVMSA